MQGINLKELVIDTRTVEVAYPGMPHFKVALNYMSRATSKRVMEESRKDEWVNGTLIKVQDDEQFLKAFIREAFKGWTGLTLADVEKLMLVELGDADLSTPVEFSEDNAYQLMSNSSAFDSWVNSVVFHLDSFRSGK